MKQIGESFSKPHLGNAHNQTWGRLEVQNGSPTRHSYVVAATAASALECNIQCTVTKACVFGMVVVVAVLVVVGLIVVRMVSMFMAGLVVVVVFVVVTVLV
jgi:hypothetical protein